MNFSLFAEGEGIICHSALLEAKIPVKKRKTRRRPYYLIKNGFHNPVFK